MEVIMTDIHRLNTRLNDRRRLEADKIDTLTSQEREIITMISKGVKDKQIAEYLLVDEIELRDYLGSIYAKLEVSDRLDLVIYAFHNGLVMVS